jgi:hypothetical protein
MKESVEVGRGGVMRDDEEGSRVVVMVMNEGVGMLELELDADSWVATPSTAEVAVDVVLV